VLDLPAAGPGPSDAVASTGLSRSLRFYAGPDTPTVARRAQLLAAALHQARPGFSDDLA